MATKAASYAARIEESLETSVDMEGGRRGQFDVVVNGRTVVSRKGGLIAKLIGRPWPGEDEVVSKVHEALQGSVE